MAAVVRSLRTLAKPARSEGSELAAIGLMGTATGSYTRSALRAVRLIYECQTGGRHRYANGIQVASRPPTVLVSCSLCRKPSTRRDRSSRTFYIRAVAAALRSGAVAGDQENEVRMNVEEALAKVGQMPEGSVLVVKRQAELRSSSQ